MDKGGKKKIEKTIRKVLTKRNEISFAYLHGSFPKEARFRDIDVAVYLENIPASILEYELQLETELMTAVGKHIIDVRVLNTAPLSFRYNVIKQGMILLVKNEDKRVDFQEKTISAYLDFLPFRNMYLEGTLGVKIQRRQDKEADLGNTGSP